MEGSRGTLEGYITLLVQHNPHTHTPLTYHLHTPTSLTSSPPPLTYTLTPSQPHTSPHTPIYSPGVSSFFPATSPSAYIFVTLVFWYSSTSMNPLRSNLTPVWSIPRSTMLVSRPTAQRRQSTPEISWGFPSNVWGTRLTVRESPVFLTSPTCWEGREGGKEEKREGRGKMWRDREKEGEREEMCGEMGRRRER